MKLFTHTAFSCWGRYSNYNFATSVVLSELRSRKRETQKHRDFVNEPVGDKPVTKLPGIGPVLGEKLEQKGIDKAYQVVGQYLLSRMDEEKFKAWLIGQCPANAGQANACYQAVSEWCVRRIL